MTGIKWMSEACEYVMRCRQVDGQNLIKEVFIETTEVSELPGKVKQNSGGSSFSKFQNKC